MTDVILKPCPFCGAPPRMWQWGIDRHTVIECSNYDADTHRVYMQAENEQDAVEWWNRRVINDARSGDKDAR